jgi:hypothetical protein
VGLGRSAQPTSRPSQPPFDLAVIQAIYSPEPRRNTSMHSPSAAEEQRREGHHLRKERFELVDKDLPSRRGNLARKTTSEFSELEARSRLDPGGDLDSCIMYYVELSSCNPISSDRVFLLRF